MRANLYQFTDNEKRMICKALNRALYYDIKDFDEDEIDYLNKLERHFDFEVDE